MQLDAATRRIPEMKQLSPGSLDEHGTARALAERGGRISREEHNCG